MFSLWQDTWYFDRKQVEPENLSYFIHSPKYQNALTNLQNATGFDLSQYRLEQNYTKIPMMIRNGLANYFNLGHVVSTKEYGCRGPVNGDPKNLFGGNTFHIEPEDVLVGGTSNLSFGQGKHVIEYLTKEEMFVGWNQFKNLSAQSGTGHILPHFEEILNIGLGGLLN